MEEEKEFKEVSDIGEEEKSKDWAGQVEEEESKLAEEEEVTETVEEMIEELRCRLAHKATGLPPVCRIRALDTFEAGEEDELSHKPGDIIVVHRLSEASPGTPSAGWVVGTLDGKWGYVPIPRAEKVFKFVL